MPFDLNHVLEDSNHVTLLILNEYVPFVINSTTNFDSALFVFSFLGILSKLTFKALKKREDINKSF